MASTRLAETAVASSVDISVFAHATEDEGRVEQAIFNIIPGVGANPKIQRLRGHYKDPIVMIMTRITKRKAAQEVLHSLIKSLSSQDRQRVLDEIEDRVDDAGNLYLRFDKQNAFRGVAMLHEVDPIHVKIKFRTPHGIDHVTAIRASIAAVINEVENASEIQSRRVD